MLIGADKVSSQLLGQTIGGVTLAVSAPIWVSRSLLRSTSAVQFVPHFRAAF